MSNCGCDFTEGAKQYKAIIDGGEDDFGGNMAGFDDLYPAHDSLLIEVDWCKKLVAVSVQATVETA